PGRVVGGRPGAETPLAASGGVPSAALFALAGSAMRRTSLAERTAVAVATQSVRHGTASVGQAVTADARPALPAAGRERTWDIPLTVDGTCVARFVGTTLVLS